MALLSMVGNNNLKVVADRVVTLLKNVRQKTSQANPASVDTIIGLHHAMSQAKTEIDAIRTQYGGNKVGLVIAERFDFDWATEAPNFAALIDTAIPDAIAYIESIQGTILVGTFNGSSITFTTPTAGQQTTLQTHINALANYLV